jgi:hypothetical protein
MLFSRVVGSFILWGSLLYYIVLIFLKYIIMFVFYSFSCVFEQTAVV